MNTKLQNEFEVLNEKRDTLLNSGVVPSTDKLSGDSYTLYVINEVANQDNSCKDTEYKKDSTVGSYCSIYNKINNPVPVHIISIVAGVLIILVFGCLAFDSKKFSGALLQGQMPLKQEELEKMAPSIGKVADEIKKR